MPLASILCGTTPHPIRRRGIHGHLAEAAAPRPDTPATPAFARLDTRPAGQAAPPLAVRRPAAGRRSPPYPSHLRPRGTVVSDHPARPDPGHMDLPPCLNLPG